MASVERTTQHLTSKDQATLREMANRVDPEEMLRTIGTIIANDHPDLHSGTAFRRKLFLLALELTEDDSWLCR
jgi:hypothetical protein